MALRDIFGRKRAMEALVRAKADWEQTFDAVPDLIALLDKDHRITRVNRSMAERLGCAPEQAVGRHCYEALHGLSAAPDFCPHARMMASGKEEHAEVVEERLGRVFDVAVIPLRDQAGDLVGCVHIAHDITGRKRIETALREIAERTAKLVETMAEGVVRIAPDGQIVQANPAAERILGLTCSEIEGRRYNCPDWKILRGDGTPMPVEERSVPRAMKEQRLVRDVEMGVVHRDGSFVWINSAAAPLLNAAGQLEGVVGTFTDITERKSAEARLREREENFHNVAESAFDGILICTADGQHVYANRRAMEMSGYSMEEILRTTFKDWLPPEELPKVRQRMMDRLAGRSAPAQYETIFIRKDGTRYPVELAATLNVWQGQTCDMVSVRDITERKRLEEEIVKIATWEKQRIGRDLHDGVAQQLAAAAYLYHGLKNRLYHDMKAVLSQAEAAKMAEIDAVLHQSLQHIRQIAHVLSPAGLDEAGLVVALQYLVASPFQGSGVKCRLEQSGDPVTLLDGRTSLNLYYLVREAVMNAVRHGSPRAIVVSLAYGEQQLLSVAVQDDGCGFDPSAVNKDGMGLQIMRYRADVIGGVLTIDSRPGGGTRIRCELSPDSHGA